MFRVPLTPRYVLHSARTNLSKCFMYVSHEFIHLKDGWAIITYVLPFLHIIPGYKVLKQTIVQAIMKTYYKFPKLFC